MLKKGSDPLENRFIDWVARLMNMRPPILARRSSGTEWRCWMTDLLQKT